MSVTPKVTKKALKKALKKSMRKCDKALSRYIRIKHLAESPLCPLCNKNPVQCCFHIVRRGRKKVRWDYHNVISSCHSCNRCEYFNPDPSRAFFIRKYGLELYLELVDLSVSDWEPTTRHLDNLTALYSRWADELVEKDFDGVDPVVKIKKKKVREKK